MTSSTCEPPEEPGPSSQAEDFFSLKQRLATERFYIAECNVGLGVFANRDIAPGEVILALEGPIIDFAETKRRGPRECMAIQVGKDTYIDTQPPGVLVNHSCHPNAGIKQNKYLVALRVIAKGEEIRYDYSTTMEEQSFTMQCRCGAPECRKIIRDFSTLPLKIQEKYLAQGIVMSFIPRATFSGCCMQMLTEVRKRLTKIWNLRKVVTRAHDPKCPKSSTNPAWHS